MTFIAVRSLGMSTETSEAWKSQGGIYPRRSRNQESIVELAYAQEAEFILNLGNSRFNPRTEMPVFNRGEDIQPLLWPGLTRTLFDDLMPPQPTEFPADVWIKAPGRAGRGKFHKQTYRQFVLPQAWDYQIHVKGEEFRLITVNDLVVQQFRREGENGNRTYSWLPAVDIEPQLKLLVKLAAARLPGNNVIAWDTILTDDRVALFEGNSCPGMSVNTARRIVDAIRATL